MNPWHDVNLGLDEANELNCLIEIPAQSKIKYEIDKESGLLKVDRILHSSVHYPCNYGLFPQTFCDDGDPLDVLVIGQAPVVPLSIMRVRPVGVLRMIDQGKGDDKVISVHVDDPEYNHIKKLKELAPHKMAEIRQFFESYKVLEKKSVEIRSIDDEHAAIEVIAEAIKFYKQKFSK
ncbi:inorganic diphosphatase [Bdellovibrio sp. HCB290]|uniref:inorganic diphosphatase n=1 Tax=Bdellovibrio sp. HCB290 TaxID=3394356 RepID=UPI0039B5FEDB